MFFKTQRTRILKSFSPMLRHAQHKWVETSREGFAEVSAEPSVEIPVGMDILPSVGTYFMYVRLLYVCPLTLCMSETVFIVCV